MEHTPEPWQPKTGAACTCRPGIERDNCPRCEGTGQVIDFAAIRSRAPRLYRGELLGRLFVETGEHRPPKAGEWYLSGAIPEAWRAPNDLTTPYHILRPATPTEATCPHCGRKLPAAT